MPFKLTFGTEAVIPLDIELLTLRTENFDLQHNKKQLQMDLDIIEEVRD